ncbi:MAG: DedA family protein, partial [Pyrinomonadaceae bacterium]
AGLNRMSLVPFLLSSIVGMALWTTVLAALGKTLGENFREVEDYFNPISYVVLGIIIALYVYRLVTHKREVKQKEKSR